MARASPAGGAARRRRGALAVAHLGRPEDGFRPPDVVAMPVCAPPSSRADRQVSGHADLPGEDGAVPHDGGAGEPHLAAQDHVRPITELWPIMTRSSIFVPAPTRVCSASRGRCSCSPRSRLLVHGHAATCGTLAIPRRRSVAKPSRRGRPGVDLDAGSERDAVVEDDVRVEPGAGPIVQCLPRPRAPPRSRPRRCAFPLPRRRKADLGRGRRPRPARDGRPVDSGRAVRGEEEVSTAARRRTDPPPRRRSPRVADASRARSAPAFEAPLLVGLASATKERSEGRPPRATDARDPEAAVADDPTAAAADVGDGERGH